MSRWFLFGLLALCTPLAWADPSPPAPSTTEPSVILNSQINSGDTAWMLASMALVLMMTVPGLALFYGGMVRRKNVLATLMQSFAITCLVTLLWYIGGLSRLFMSGVIYIKDVAAAAATKDTPAVEAVIGKVSVSHLGVTIPETVYAMFQLTFAIITPALIWTAGQRGGGTGRAGRIAARRACRVGCTTTGRGVARANRSAVRPPWCASYRSLDLGGASARAPGAMIRYDVSANPWGRAEGHED
jgi:hypothetical protein